MSPSLKRWARLAAIVVLLAIPLALVLSRMFGGLLRDLVAVPFLYLVWIGQLYLRAVPRALFWAALLLFGLTLAIVNGLMASDRLETGETQAGRDRNVPGAYQGPVEQLASQINAAERSRYVKRRLAQRLGSLALRCLGGPEQYRLADIKQGLDTLEAPAPIRAFLKRSEWPGSPSRRADFIAWLRRRLGRIPAQNAVREELERVVRCLEDELEGV